MDRPVGTDAELELIRSRTKVAFIAGASWSGSTVLEQALAQLDDCVSVGESFWIWDRHWPQMTCECGKEFRACEFWSAVLSEAYGPRSDQVRAGVRARSQGLWRHSILPTLVRSRSPFHPRRALAELGDLVAPLYRAVAKISGASHVVDASKAGLWGLALSYADAIELRVVHLVRDPAAYLASDGQRREVPYPAGATRAPRPPTRSLVTWLLLHGEAELLARRDPWSPTVLYDDIARGADMTADRIARSMGLDVDVDRIFEDGALVVRRPGHAIGGNPRRPGPGETPIERQDRPTPPRRLPLLVRRALLPISEARYRHLAAQSTDQLDALR